jgi:hypothetical protein
VTSTTYRYPLGQHTKHDGARAESRRRLVVGIVFFIYGLSLIEGPLRKWFLPGLGSPLTFLRDPFVVALYLFCFGNGLVSRGRLAQSWFAIALLSSFWGAICYYFLGVSELGWGLGVRSYWLYMPMAFIIAVNFRSDDVVRFLYLNVLIAVPYAFLVALQYNAGPTAWINHGIAGDDEAAIGLGGDIVRPFGLFTYSGQNTRFVAATLALFISIYLMRVRIRFRILMIGIGAVAIGAMAILTGSRSIYFFAGAIVGLTVIGSTIARPSFETTLRNLGVAAFVALSGYLLMSAFPDMLSAMERRFVVAEQSEGSIWDRALGGLFSFVEPLFTAPPMGAGIGVGAPGVAQFLGIPTLSQGEGDLARNLNELGVLVGVMLIALRFFTALWLVGAAVSLASRRNLAALPLAGYAAVEIAFGQITNSPLSAFLPWVVTGLILALVNEEKIQKRHRLPLRNLGG